MENRPIGSGSLSQTRPAKLSKPCPAAPNAGPPLTEFIALDDIRETRAKIAKVFWITCCALMPVMSCAISTAGGSNRQAVALTGLITSIPLALTIITLSIVKCRESCCLNRGYVVIDDPDV